MKFFDTIAAIATPLGSGGIAVIRISGEEAVKIARRIVFPESGKRLSDLESRKMTLSKVKTADGKLSAHYEHTLAVTDNGVVLLTQV